MAREKKITIKYFLNTELNPSDEEGQDRYPLYVRITYDRSTTKVSFPITYNFGYLTEKEFKKYVLQRQDKETKQELEDFERDLKKVIRFEARVQGEEYKVTGIKQRLDYYYHPLLQVLETVVRQSLIMHAAANYLNEEEAEAFMHPAINVVQMARILIDKIGAETFLKQTPAPMLSMLRNYTVFKAFTHTQYHQAIIAGDYPQVIDWLDESYQQAFVKYLLQQVDTTDLVAQVDHFWREWKEFILTSSPTPNTVVSVESLIVSYVFEY